MEYNKQPTDEIDLLELLAKAVQTIRNNFAMIISAFVLGSLIGLAYYQVSPNVFESKMIIYSDILTESYSKSLVENIAKLIKEGNIESASKKLNLAPEQTSKIASIKISSALEKSDNTPEINKVYLNIEVGMKDNSIWPELQAKIIEYLQNNEYVKIRVDQRKKYISKVIEKIDLELIDLGKLKVKMTEGGFTQSTKENLILFDPTTINSKILDLNKEKINLQNSLETINSVQVVEGFTVFNKPSSPKLSLSLVAGSSVGLFLVFLFIAFKGIRSMLKFSEEKLKEA